MTRVQPDAQWRYLCGKGDDDGLPYVVLIDVDGKLIISNGITTVDAADVTYTPDDASNWNGGVDPGNQNSANDQLADRVKTLEAADLLNKYPTRAWWVHDSMRVISGAAITTYINAGQVLCVSWYQNPFVDGDELQYSTLLKAGAYTIKTVGVTDPNSGKVDISYSLSGSGSYTSITTGQDWYSAGFTANVAKTATFTLSVSGLYIFKFKVNGKNVSSGNYIYEAHYHSIYLTAAES